MTIVIITHNYSSIEYSKIGVTMDSHGERVRYLENLIREHKILTSSLKSSFPLFPPFLLFANYRLNIILIIPVKFFDAQFKLQYSKSMLGNIRKYNNI